MATAVPHIERPRISERADRVRNRDKLVDAARGIVLEQGADAPLSAIARRAGLSTATLYRHFEDREALLSAIYEREIGRCQNLLADAGTSEGPGPVLFRVLRDFAVIEAEQPGAMAALVGRLGVSRELAEFRERSFGQLQRLIRQAQDEHLIRDDMTLADIRLLLVSIRSVIQAAPENARTDALRTIELFERGCLPAESSAIGGP